MGEAELRVNQSRQTALDEGTPSPEQEGEKICRQGLDNSGNIEALPHTPVGIQEVISWICQEPVVF
jgi:hypothetical protein